MLKSFFISILLLSFSVNADNFVNFNDLVKKENIQDKFHLIPITDIDVLNQRMQVFKLAEESFSHINEEKIRELSILVEDDKRYINQIKLFTLLKLYSESLIH